MAEDCIAAEVDASLYPAAVLIDDLRSDNMHRRLKSIQNLATIAEALGTERTCEEFLPFLQEECTDDDDEVLLEMAAKLEQGVSWVGGPNFAHALLLPLEELCCAEEISVRERAAQAITKLALDFTRADAIAHLCELIMRLASHDWYTARMSACLLIPTALTKVSEVSQKNDLLRVFFRLCNDDTAMTRRQAATGLSEIADVLGEDPMQRDVIQAFDRLARDEQDSVRILASTNCIALGKLNKSSVWQQQLMAAAIACGDDKSWRVRYTVADHSRQLCNVFESHAKATIIPLFVRLLSDQDMEVRAVAASRIGQIAELNPKKEFLESLIAPMEKLTLPKESSLHVRISLAGSILTLAPVFGGKLTQELLVGIYNSLIKDEASEVRLKLVDSFDALTTISDAELVLASLLPSIKELAKDKQWRVRLTVLSSMPALAKCLGDSRFSDELLNLFLVWMADDVFAVRHAAAETYKRLCEVFGNSWSESKLIPQLSSMASHKNYLYRVSAVPCIGLLAEVMGSDAFEKSIVPILEKVASDPVPNVRLQVGKTVKTMHKNCPSLPLEKVRPCLQRLASDDDPDAKFFAQSCLDQMDNVAT